MSKTDTTPFRDPRNAVGLLTDVLDLALAGPKLSTLTLGFMFEDGEILRAVIAARDLGREFTKSSRRALNGYARKSHSGLYQRVKKAREQLPADTQLFSSGKIRELYATIGSIGDRGLAIVETVMEDVTQWKKYTHGWTERVYGRLTAHDPQWHRDWHDHVSSALRLGVDRNAISDLECGWRFRDLTDRSHRGRNVRAAFEAAWLAGQYKFAQQLIAERLK